MTDPVAAYSFDEASGAVLDRTGNGHDWTLNNGAIRTASGHTNGGLAKNAAGLPVIAATPFLGTGAWTFMFWQQGLGDAVWWMRLYNTAADTGSGLLRLSGTLRLRIRKTGNTEVSVTPPADGLYHHYAATYDGTVGKLYVDGVLVGTTATATAPTAAVNRIDCMEHTVNPPTGAYMDDMRFWTSALDVTEINTWMNTPVTDAPAGITGVLDATLPLPVLDLAGASTVTGVLDGTLPLPVAALSGSLRVSGSLGATLPLVALDVAGTARIQGSLAGVLPLPAMDLAGSVSVAGELAGELPLPVLDLAGTVSEATIVGVLVGVLPVPQLALTGTSAGIPPHVPESLTAKSVTTRYTARSVTESTHATVLET